MFKHPMTMILHVLTLQTKMVSILGDQEQNVTLREANLSIPNLQMMMVIIMRQERMISKAQYLAIEKNLLIMQLVVAIKLSI